MTEESTPYKPLYLGEISRDAIEKVDIIPWESGSISITLTCDEFTTRCPITTQPDFGSLEITYTPNKHIIETKSLKLYLTGFRDLGVFSERLVCQLAQDLYEQVKPHYISVTGDFNSRGGVAIHATTELPDLESV